MSDETRDSLLRVLSDEREIRQRMLEYARGVDRREWDLVRSVFHPGAYNDHGEYAGSADGFVDWLSARHVKVEASMHFISNCHIEFHGSRALVETYFTSRRAVPASSSAKSGDPAVLLENIGRYVDQFEKRDGRWGVVHRTTVFDARYTADVALTSREPPNHWARRDREDTYWKARERLLAT